MISPGTCWRRATEKLATSRSFQKTMKGPAKIIKRPSPSAARAYGMTRETSSFKTNLAVALDDLAGVAPTRAPSMKRGRFSRSPKSSSPNCSDRTPRFSRTGSESCTRSSDRQGWKNRNSSSRGPPRFFERILDRVNTLKREGWHDGPDDLSTNARALTTEIAYCEAAPRARGDFDFARSRPPAVSARLLVLYARSTGEPRQNPTRVAAVGEALLALKSESPEDLYYLARSLALFISHLDMSPDPDVMSANERLCANDALTEG